MNAPIKAASLPALAMSEVELLNVLRNSLYPGAQNESIKLVIGYCKAAGLDPMQKPVHIVPMWDKDTKRMRDVIMPGIGSYRVQAARSGEYAGVSEPEFGPDVNEQIGNILMTYPAWCRVIVKRALPNGTLAEFAATERWLENYATAGKDTTAPNAMWKRRPYAQLAKCAEAQALRKAFPEIGAAPTADEMEGKEYGEVIEQAPATSQEPTALPFYPADAFSANIGKWREAIASGKKTAEQIVAMVATKGTLSAEQIEQIHAPAPAAADTPDLYAQVKRQLETAQSLDTLDVAADLIGEVSDPAQRQELTALYQKRTEEMA